ncbi:hypothetical protein ACJ2A9_07595 [Anaerobacillus sp. MEB173]|uniref:hypothetical protein n=1 Tax=Anaerobacillus sp. MEB173 TaxID=3383345 RepID=UPI003F8E1B82
MEELDFLNEDELKKVKEIRKKMSGPHNDQEFKRLCTEMAIMIERARNRKRNKGKTYDYN